MSEEENSPRPKRGNKQKKLQTSLKGGKFKKGVRARNREINTIYAQIVALMEQGMTKADLLEDENVQLLLKTGDIKETDLENMSALTLASTVARTIVDRRALLDVFDEAKKAGIKPESGLENQPLYSLLEKAEALFEGSSGSSMTLRTESEVKEEKETLDRAKAKLSSYKTHKARWDKEISATKESYEYFKDDKAKSAISEAVGTLRETQQEARTKYEAAQKALEAAQKAFDEAQAELANKQKAVQEATSDAAKAAAEAEYEAAEKAHDKAQAALAATQKVHGEAEEKLSGANIALNNKQLEIADKSARAEKFVSIAIPVGKKLMIDENKEIYGAPLKNLPPQKSLTNEFSEAYKHLLSGSSYDIEAVMKGGGTPEQQMAFVAAVASEIV